MEYDNNNSGILFKNDYKEEGSKQPDYKGSFTDANGEEKDLAAWIRIANSGKKFLSVKVSDKYVKQEVSTDSAPVIADEPNDDIPF